MSNLNRAWFNDETGDIHSPKGRMVWPVLLEAKQNRKFPEKPPSFNVSLMLPKTADIKVLTAAIVKAATDKFGKDWQKKKVRLPIVKTEDNEKLAEFAAEFPYFLKASANLDFPPAVFGPDKERFNGPASEVYSGRWGVVVGGPWAYDKGSNGVSWNLIRAQLLDHDDVIAGGRVLTNSGFEAATVAARAGAEASSSDAVFPAGDKVGADDEDPFA